MLQSNSTTRRAILTQMLAVGGQYHTVTLGLSKAPHSFSPDDVLADLTATECNFGGYSRSGAVVWNTVYDDPTGAAVVVGDLKLFICTNSVTPQDAYLTFWVNGGVLVGQENYADPQPARAANDYISYLPQLSFSQ